jgi:2,5-dihydroxypyridine 5,6-dioxygenase
MNPGEHVVIVSDGTLSSRILEAFATAAYADGAKVCRVTYRPNIYIPMKCFSTFAGISQNPSLGEPPAPVSGALREADVIVLLSSDMAIFFSQAYREALAGGKRIIRSPYITEQNLLILFPESEEEVTELDALTLAIGGVFESGKAVRFTSHRGTDFECAFGQYEVRCNGGRIRKASKGEGERFSAEFIPAGAVTRVPDDGSAEGMVIVDGTIAAPNLRQLSEPIKLEIERGYVRAISGGWEANELKRFIEELGGGEMYHVTELGVGTNKRCNQRGGVAAPAEDTHTAGSVNIALGCDVHIGGSTYAPAHVDCTTRGGNLQVGDIEVVREGTILLGVPER